MGGSTNTILHLLAAVQEAGIDFDMGDIDRLSRKVPQLCKVAPNTPEYHIEDVHRAGGIMGIMEELNRTGLIHGDLPTVHSPSLPEALDKLDIVSGNDTDEVKKFYKADTAGTHEPTAIC